MIVEFNELDYCSIEDAITRLYKLKKDLLKSDHALVDKYKKDNLRYHRHLASIQKAYDTVQAIYNTDISSIYEKGSENEFYVYAHCNPMKQLDVKEDEKHAFAAINLGLRFEPFYIGKGIGNRCYDFNRNEGHRKIRQMISRVSKEIIVVKIKENLFEHEALCSESKLIDIFGLKSLWEHNFLVNLDEGKLPIDRRTLYPKGSSWYLNRNKMAIYKRNSAI
jgi:hypothetical protein